MGPPPPATQYVLPFSIIFATAQVCISRSENAVAFVMAGSPP